MQFVKGGPDVPERLLQAHEDGRVVFFCGAGISNPAGLPSFRELVNKLYCCLEIAPDPVQKAAIKDKRYDTAVDLLERNTLGGRKVVRRQLAQILEADTSLPNATSTHEALLTLGGHEGRTRLVTTNFDRLFEHALSCSGRDSVKSFEAPSLPVPKNRWDGLVYLHGLLPEDPAGKNLDSLVVSSGDFGLAYLTERWAARFASELLRNFVVCFVGYSIDDPVLRYMTDALAADRLLGESSLEMFAFGSFSQGKKDVCANEWRAKNVTPILYQEHCRHCYLHKTLRAWAGIYRDGVRGKESIVTKYARARPGAATGTDDFVSRMLWALSDPSGLPARRFADLNPAPPLDWLEVLAEDRFRHADLIRFGVPPKADEDGELKFSLTRRPAPYDQAPQMALADAEARGAGYDEVMRHLARWLTRHLNNPDLLLSLVRQGGRLHADMAQCIAHSMNRAADLELPKKQEELVRIRANAPDAIPDARMRKLWSLLLSGRVKQADPRPGLREWWKRFKREGLTTALRLELRKMLAPRVSLREPFRWPSGNEEQGEDQESIRRLVDWDIVLSARNVHATLRDWQENEKWVAALPALLPDLTGLLRDALELMRDLGGATEGSDLSYLSQPSISDHSQNTGVREWTALVELNRDAWLAMAELSPEQARITAQAWSNIPYPIFRRLALFAAAQDGIVPPGWGLGWILENDGRWLWSVETQRETFQLLVALAPQLDEDELTRLERAILAGPLREKYRDDIGEELWIRIRDEDIWLRLIKMSRAGANLNTAARERLEELARRYPDWKLSENQREEFPTWMSVGRSELRAHVPTPRDQTELVEWLREDPEPDIWRQDDWRGRCRDDFKEAAAALTALADEGVWPTNPWREALQVWSEEELIQCSWREMAPVLANVPPETLRELADEVSWWLEKLSLTFEGGEGTFLSLCDHVLALEFEVDDGSGNNPVEDSINHPIGNVTEALLRWWHRNGLEDGQKLSDQPRERFSRLCNTRIPKFRHGRVLLATRVVSLFRIDREWTSEFLLPLFEWGNSEVEARSAWDGFLWSPRLYPPLMEVLKPAFLNTAKHYARLGRHSGEQYAALLTFVGLDSGDVFRKRELKLAMRELPQAALEHAAEALAQAVDGAGERRAEYWKNRVSPYLRTIWPRTRDSTSHAVSESFSRACIAAGEAFPEALEAVGDWLQPVKYPFRVAHALHEAELDGRFPRQALELLDRTVGGDARHLREELKSCLRAMRQAEQSLEQDSRFQRLEGILRADGGELN